MILKWNNLLIKLFQSPDIYILLFCYQTTLPACNDKNSWINLLKDHRKEWPLHFPQLCCLTVGLPRFIRHSQNVQIMFCFFYAQSAIVFPYTNHQHIIYIQAISPSIAPNSHFVSNLRFNNNKKVNYQSYPSFSPKIQRWKIHIWYDCQIVFLDHTNVSLHQHFIFNSSLWYAQKLGIPSPASASALLV